MTEGGISTAWPRRAAHLAVLLTVGALWGLPIAKNAAASSGVPEALSTTRSAVPGLLHEMASRPRVTAALPAGSALFITPAGNSSSGAKKATAPKGAKSGGSIAPVPAIQALPRTGWGSDISWPQCGGAVPGPHDVGVVGVTDGRPFTTNPCMAGEYGWATASQMAGGAQLYINLEVGGSSDGPHHCGTDDHNCRAYDYGWVSVADAMARAGEQGASSAFWWLDVEVGNSWSDTLELNSQTVQGAIDAIHSRNLDAGIYSSADQWAQIVPDTYKPGVPTWLAVVGDPQMAPGLCSLTFSLSGGPVYMVQYDDHGFDSDHVCSAGTSGFTAAAARRGN